MKRYSIGKKIPPPPKALRKFVRHSIVWRDATVEKLHSLRRRREFRRPGGNRGDRQVPRTFNCIGGTEATSERPNARSAWRVGRSQRVNATL